METFVQKRDSDLNQQLCDLERRAQIFTNNELKRKNTMMPAPRMPLQHKPTLRNQMVIVRQQSAKRFRMNPKRQGTHRSLKSSRQGSFYHKNNKKSKGELNITSEEDEFEDDDSGSSLTESDITSDEGEGGFGGLRKNISMEIVEEENEADIYSPKVGKTPLNQGSSVSKSKGVPNIEWADIKKVEVDNEVMSDGSPKKKKTPAKVESSTFLKVLPLSPEKQQ